MAKKIAVINGPNLNLLGTREPEIYGSITLGQIVKNLEKIAAESGYSIEHLQSNNEGELVDAVQKAGTECSGILINAGAYTHTSIALHDAIRGQKQPAIEVHLSNVYRRESFRHHSYISPVAEGVIAGFGPHSYELALQALLKILKGKKT
jgi:3-dehydroquinate dehydratase-2